MSKLLIMSTWPLGHRLGQNSRQGHRGLHLGHFGSYFSWKWLQSMFLFILRSHFHCSWSMYVHMIFDIKTWVNNVIDEDLLVKLFNSNYSLFHHRAELLVCWFCYSLWDIKFTNKFKNNRHNEFDRNIRFIESIYQHY